MKKALFVHIVANILLVGVVVCVSAVGLLGSVTNVFSKDDYAPIYRGNGQNKVALMVNVYWGTEYLQGFLEIFNKYGVHATFFVGGCWVAQNPDWLAKIAEAGHEIGNHGYFHKDHAKLTYQQNADEIVACSKLVFEYIGTMPALFAPPSGEFSAETLRAAKDSGCKTILWTRDTIDWRDEDSELVFSRATRDVGNGELILMHPTAHTLQALEKILNYYFQNKIQPVTVGEIIR